MTDSNIPVVQTDIATVLSILGRAASDPNTDVAKVEKFLDLYERMAKSNAETEFNAAFSLLHADLPAIAEKGAIKVNDEVRSKYALYEDIVEQTKPALQKHGFAFSGQTVTAEAGKVIFRGTLTHKGGHSRSTDVPLPIDSSGSKNAVQAIKSSLSYGQRIAYTLLLNIVTRGEDDDGQKSDLGYVAITEKQAADLEALIDEVKANKVEFLKWAKVNKIGEIGAAAYNDCVRALRQKGRTPNKPEAKK